MNTYSKPGGGLVVDCNASAAHASVATGAIIGRRNPLALETARARTLILRTSDQDVQSTSTRASAKTVSDLQQVQQGIEA